MPQMKFAIALLPLFAFLFLSSCHNRNTNSIPDKAAIAGTAPATSGSDAVFSYTIAGTKISGGPTDVILANNIAVIQKSGQTKNMQFFLNDVSDKNSSTFTHSLRFTLPPTKGTFQLTASKDNGFVELFVPKGADESYVVYENEAFTVTVGDISSTRVSGTFSGKVKSVSAPVVELTLADGKFDIPLRNADK
jgi:hypothetical protein